MYLMWQRVKAAFPRTPVVICFATREATSWQRSAWAEHIKSSGMTLDFDEFCTQYPAASDLQSVVSAVTSRVPTPVHSYTLEDCAALPLGPADPVFDLCDIPDNIRAALLPQSIQNTRFDDETLAALLQINRTHTDTGERNAAKDALLGKGATL